LDESFEVSWEKSQIGPTVPEAHITKIGRRRRRRINTAEPEALITTYSYI
jgi:hypothetical protein